MRPISVEDLFELKTVSSVEVFNDEAVFTVKRIDREKNKYFTNIYLYRIKEGEIRRLTFADSSDTKPKWHPEGKGIFFVSNRNENSQIYFLRRDGGEAERITDFPEGSILDYSISPDGKRLAIVFMEKLEHLKKENVKSRKEKNLSTPPMEITTQYYKLDGFGYFLDKRPKVFVWDLEKNEKTEIPTGKVFWNSSPTFSPNGKFLAFLSSNPEEGENKTYVKLYDLENGKISDITPLDGPKGNLMFISEKTLAFLGHDDPKDGWGTRNVHLWVFEIGKDAKNLTKTLDNSIGYSLLSDTGEFGEGGDLRYRNGRFYFLLTEMGNATIYTADFNGNWERVFEFKGGITSFDTNGEVFVFSGSTPTVPPELWVFKGEVKKVSDFNDWIRDVELSEPEEVWVESEGVKVQTWILKPPDFNPDKKYPAILYIHGGPHAAYGNVFFHEFQLMVANGYVLVYSNPRGSKGYGEEFARAIKGDWGNLDFKDIMSVANFVKNLPYVDEKRMGITGGSYGGYMTNWVIGNTDMFKAAITDRSVVNLVSMMGTADFPFSPDQYWEGDFWDRIEKLWERSPLRLVKNVKTPLLIIHSEGDYRCPISEAEQLFKALKVLGKEVVFVRYPAETSHGLSRSGPPDLRVDRLRRYLDWWGKYLS